MFHHLLLTTCSSPLRSRRNWRYGIYSMADSARLIHSGMARQNGGATVARASCPEPSVVNPCAKRSVPGYLPALRVELAGSGRARQNGGASVVRASCPEPSVVNPCAKRSVPGCLLALLVALALPAAAQIAAWDFYGDNTAAATSAAEVFDGKLDSPNTVTRGSTAAASVANNSFRTKGFEANGISTSNTDYFQVTLSAAAGYTLSLGTIDASFFGTDTFHAAPGVSGQFAYSLDGTAFELIGSPFVMTATGIMPQIDISGISALQNLPDATTVTLRYYASGQTSSGGWGFHSAAAGEYGLAIGGTLAISLLPSLTLTASPSAFAENAPAATGTVTIPAPLIANLIVSLASADITEATVPATVTIMAGLTTATFDITPVNDALADGPQTFNLTSFATGYNSGLLAITVNDDGDAPPALGPGALAFVGFNADGDDDLAFAALVPIAANETIFFTDKAWNGLDLGKGGAFSVEEGILSWTAPVGGVMVGTVVTLSNLCNGIRRASVGTLTASGSFNLSGDGETVYAYQGTVNSPTGFLAIIATQTSDATTGTSLNPAHIVNLTNSIDIAAYTGARGDQAGFAAYLAAINTPGKWTTQDGAGNQHNDSTAPDVPFDVTAFTLASATGYAAWARDNANNEAATVDSDGDGVSNGIEYFMGEPRATFTPSPAMVNGKITWPHNANASATYAVKTSTDLIRWDSATSGVKDNGNSIEFTLPNIPSPVFVRLEVVTGP